MPTPKHKADVENLTSSDFEVKQRKVKKLFFDIESASIEMRAWRAYKANAIRVTRDRIMLSWSAKWEGGKHITRCLADYEGYAPGSTDDKALVADLAKLFDEADIIVGHNGDSFDIRLTHTRMLVHHIPPPPPVKTVDTLKIARNKFGFAQNSLKALAKSLGCDEQKGDAGGYETWEQCEQGDQKAWNRMKKYNAQDVRVLIHVYERMKPWMTSHPNEAVIRDIEDGCRNCGSMNLQRRGRSVTLTGTRIRVHCQNCGTWSTGKHRKTTDFR